MTRPEDAKLACGLGAWAVGLVLAPESPRRLSFEQAAVVREAVPPEALAVGVFEGQEVGEVRELSRALRLDAVQIHGGDPRDYAGFPAPVVWAHGLKPGEGTPAPPDWGPFALLLEPARAPADRKEGRRPGLEERRRAWAAAAALKGQGALVVAAGGLTPQNAEEAARASRADALDVSSGVESAPGIKDPQLLRAFFAAVAAL